MIGWFTGKRLVMPLLTKQVGNPEEPSPEPEPEPVAFMYNEVELPGLPDLPHILCDDKFLLQNPTYTYGSHTDTMSGYVAIWGSYLNPITLSDGNLISKNIVWYSQFNEASGEWGSLVELPPFKYSFRSSDIIWANFKILNSDGSLFMEGTEPVPVYE